MSTDRSDVAALERTFAFAGALMEFGPSNTFFCHLNNEVKKSKRLEKCWWYSRDSMGGM